MNRIRIVYFIVFFIGAWIPNLQAQILNNSRISTDLQYGFLIPEYSFFSYLTHEPIRGIELNAAKEFSGKQIWHKVYRYPELGFSLLYTTLGNDDVFGRAWTLQPFMSFKLLNRPKFILDFRIGTGVGYVTKYFNAETNYQNIALGSALNVYFNSQIKANFKIWNQLYLNAGLSFSHLSNANLAEPNIGLNTISAFLGAELNLLEEKNRKEPNPVFDDYNEFDISIYSGLKKTRRFAANRFVTISSAFEYRRHMGHKLALGAGVDVFYDSSIPTEMRLKGEENPSDWSVLKTGIHVSQTIKVGTVSLIIQEGIYVGMVDKLEGQTFYNRGILRYQVSKKWYVQASMKTNLMVLDVMEIGLAYAIQ